jgi:hypothetical protein
MEHKSDESGKVLQWVAVLMEPEEGSHLEGAKREDRTTA